MSLRVKVIDFISSVSKIASTHKQLLLRVSHMSAVLRMKQMQNLVSCLVQASPPYLCRLGLMCMLLRDDIGTPT